jgi:PleD family two-component response regulator
LVETVQSDRSQPKPFPNARFDRESPLPTHLAAQAALGCSQHHVLVVEDNLDVRSLIVSHFETYGIYTIGVTGHQQLARYAADNRPDLVILDLSPPHGGGFELLRELRSARARRSS